MSNGPDLNAVGMIGITLVIGLTGISSYVFGETYTADVTYTMKDHGVITETVYVRGIDRCKNAARTANSEAYFQASTMRVVCTDESESKVYDKTMRSRTLIIGSSLKN